MTHHLFILKAFLKSICILSIIYKANLNVIFIRRNIFTKVAYLNNVGYSQKVEDDHLLYLALT